MVRESIATVMEGTEAEWKGWFVLIRKAWENIRDRIEDELSGPKRSLCA